MKKSIFDEVAQFVDVLVVHTLLFSILLRRDNHFYSCVYCLSNDRICVVSPVSQQSSGVKAFNQLRSVLTISCGTFSDKYSDRHTIRIHGQMYLGVEPPFVRAIS